MLVQPLTLRRMPFALALVLALFLAPAMPQAQGGRPAMVGVAEVEVREVAETVQVFGEIVASRQAALASRISGVISQTFVQTGDTVDAGDPLVRLDTELLEIERAVAEADAAVARAGREVANSRLTSARRGFERAQALRGSQTISEGALEDREGAFAEALGALQQAEARILAAEASLDRARYNLENAVVRAPFSGTILSVSAAVGAFLPTGAEVAVLLDSSALEVEANVPARFVVALEPGLDVTGATDFGTELALQVRAVLPTESSATRTRPVRLVASGAGFAAGETPVALGQSVSLMLPVSAPREALTVPKDALIQSGGGWSAFVNQDGKAVPRSVEVGAALGDSFEVLSGLEAGDEVVVRGNERLRPMQDIMPMGGAPGGPEAQRAGAGSGAPPTASN